MPKDPAFVGNATITGNIAVSAQVSVGTRIIMSDGVIQRGGAPLTTGTLGLYSRNLSSGIKFSTNGGLFEWASDDNAGGYIMRLTSAGALNVTNNVTAYASDKRLKRDITPLPDALERVKKLRGVSFTWRDEGPQPMRGPDVGLIAQDVLEVLPEAVSLAPFDRTDVGESKSGMNYLTVDGIGNKLVALLVEAVKDLGVRLERVESCLTK